MVDSISNSWMSVLNSAAGGANDSSSTTGTSRTTDSTTTASTNPNNALDKDAFLQLMVAELSYQDPLEPMDNTEFIAQLAQFSSLEQMQNIATGMNLLALTQTAATNSQMVNLIGKRVITSGDTVSWDGTHAAEIRFDLSEVESTAEMVVKDSSGTVVRHITLSDLETGTNNVTFDGLDDDGNKLATGNYTYEVLGSDGKAISDITTYANYLIDAVAFNGSNTLLKSNGATIELADVSEVIGN